MIETTFLNAQTQTEWNKSTQTKKTDKNDINKKPRQIKRQTKNVGTH